MIIVGYSILFISIIFLVSFSFLFFVFITESMLFGHSLPTSSHATTFLPDIIKQYNPKAKNFYDVGCAHGIFSLKIKKMFPHLNIFGIDNSFVRIFFARTISFVLKRKINFLKKDIFDTDFSDADIIFTYLWYDLMPPLEIKLQNELKKGALVITNTSHFSNWQPISIVTTHKPTKMRDFETLFVYIKV